MIRLTSEWEDVFKQFQCKGTIEMVQPYGSGHINDTFLVTIKDPEHLGQTEQEWGQKRP